MREAEYKIGQDLYGLYFRNKELCSGVVSAIKLDDNKNYLYHFGDADIWVSEECIFETEEAALAKKDTISCGFGKWGMRMGRDFEVIVSFNHYPNVGEISLYDASLGDLRRLGEMFLKASETNYKIL